MNKEDAVKKINESESEDFQVFTKDEHTTFLDNLENTEQFKKKIDTRFLEMSNKYEDDVFEITGLKKKTNEKTHEFVKATLKDLHEKSDSKQYTDRIAELEKALKEKSTDETLKNEFDTFKKKHKEAVDNWENERKELISTNFKTKARQEVEKGLIGIKFKDTAIIPESVREKLIASAVDNIVAQADSFENEIVYRDEKGEIRVDTYMKPLRSSDILKEELKDIIDTGKQQKGVGIKTKEPVITEEDGKIIVEIDLPESVKTKKELSTHLRELGMKPSSKEYMAAYAKYSKDMKFE